ncbi:hypothetical protein EI94DRAFT_1492222, partial [Lactarius quietus]
HQFTLAISITLAIGKKAMNWYYNKTNYSEVYPDFYGSSPSPQAQVFQRQKWKDAWI